MPTVRYDNTNGTAFVCGQNGFNYRIQTPRTGITGWFTLNGFTGKFELDPVASGSGPGSIQNQIDTLPKLSEDTPTKTCQCLQQPAQSSNQCLQRRRTLRNFNNSQSESKKRKQLSMTRNKNKIRFNNNFPGLMFYLINIKPNGNKVFRKLCKVNGVYKCKGNIVVPRGMSLDKYLCMKSKRKEVIYYSINSYPTSDTVLYNKYIYRNGLWNFEDTVGPLGINETPPQPFIRNKISVTDRYTIRE